MMETTPLKEAFSGLSPPTEGNDQYESMNGQLESEGQPKDESILLMEDAIELLDIGWYQYTIGIIAGLCLSADGIEILLLSFLSIVLQAEWHLSASEAATITSCVFAGSFLGTLVQGPLGDTFGRRPIFLCASGMIAVFGWGTAFSQNLWQLICMRFLVGVGLGGCFVPFDAVSEVLPQRYRGKQLMFLQFLWTAGTMSVPVLAYLTLPGGDWRLFVVACALPCTAAEILGIWLVPESPRWLVTHGHEEKALQILRQAALWNGKDPNKVFPVGTKLLVQNEESDDNNCCQLFDKKWFWTTIKLCASGWGEGFLYYGAVLSITLVFSHPSGNGIYHFDYGAIFTSCTAEVVGAITVVVVVDSIGRIQTQAWSWIVGGLSTALLCLLADPLHGSWFLIFLAYVARVCMMSGSSTLWISVAEIMTTGVRTTGHSAVFAAGRIGGLLCPYLIRTTTPLPTIAAVVGLVGIFTTSCTWCLPETKGIALGSTVRTT